jgi:hypothetical protein
MDPGLMDEGVELPVFSLSDKKRGRENRGIRGLKFLFINVQ